MPFPVSPPGIGSFSSGTRSRAASSFAHGGKGTKTPPGTAQDGHFVSIFAFPRTPLRGTRTCQVLQYFRRAKFEWLSAIPAGPLGPRSAKFAAGAIQLPRLALPSKRSRCWIRRRGGCPHPPASLPLPPITVATPLGGQCPSGAQNLSGFPQFPSGHRALSLQKLPLVRFRFRAWLCRADDGWCRAVGRGLLDAPHISAGRPVSGPYEKEGRSPDSP